MTKRTTGLALGLLGVGLLGATIIQARTAASAGAASAPAPITPTDAAGGVAAEGRVLTYPGSEVVVGVERAGRLLRMLVEERQKVRRGDLLAELESDELRAALAESRAHVVEAEAELRLGEQNLKRRRELVAQRIVADHDLDQAVHDVETARARLQTAQATVERQEAQLKKTRILAPISGTVITRHVQAGETLESGARVVTLADLDRLRIEGEADEADAGALAVGAPVRITCDAYPGRSWRGTVEEVADAVTPRRLKPQDPARPTDTRVLGVKVAFAEPLPLRLGTTVELRIAAAR
jgi:RND family efflux transporter MFP subunit